MLPIFKEKSLVSFLYFSLALSSDETAAGRESKTQRDYYVCLALGLQHSGAIDATTVNTQDAF